MQTGWTRKPEMQMQHGLTNVTALAEFMHKIVLE